MQRSATAAARSTCRPRLNPQSQPQSRSWPWAVLSLVGNTATLARGKEVMCENRTILSQSNLGLEQACNFKHHCLRYALQSYILVQIAFPESLRFQRRGPQVGLRRVSVRIPRKINSGKCVSTLCVVYSGNNFSASAFDTPGCTMTSSPFCQLTGVVTRYLSPICRAVKSIQSGPGRL
jgi:hypothetical protein